MGTSTLSKELIQYLYYQRQWSVRQIAEHLSLSMRVVYNFMRRYHLPRRDFSTLNQLRLESRPLSYQLATHLSKEGQQLKMAGTLLYWAEGAKRGQTVDFANSDVAMHLIFMKFLREVCGVEEAKLRGYLYCHANQDPTKLIRFWSSCLQLSERHFTKPYVRQLEKSNAGSEKRRKRMENGLLHIRYSDVRLLQQISKWIVDIKVTMGRYQSGQMGLTVKRQPVAETLQ